MAFSWFYNPFSSRRSKEDPAAAAAPEPIDPDSPAGRCLEFISEAKKSAVRLQKCDELGYVHLFFIPFPGLDINGLVTALCKEVGCFRAARPTPRLKDRTQYSLLEQICEASRSHVMTDPRAAARYIHATQQMFMLRMLSIGRYVQDHGRVIVHSLSPVDGKYFELPLILAAFKDTPHAFSEAEIATFRSGYRINRKMMEVMKMTKNSVWVYPQLGSKAWTQLYTSLAMRHSPAYMRYVENYRNMAETFFEENKFTANKHAVCIAINTLDLTERPIIWDIAQMLCIFVMNQNDRNAWGVQTGDDEIARRRYMYSAAYLHERRGLAVVANSFTETAEDTRESASSISADSSRSAPPSSASSEIKPAPQPKLPVSRRAQSERRFNPSSVPQGLCRQSGVRVGATPPSSAAPAAPAILKPEPVLSRSVSFGGTPQQRVTLTFSSEEAKAAEDEKRLQELLALQESVRGQESVRRLSLLDELQLQGHKFEDVPMGP
jgi:hypothetical protein